MNTTPLDMFIFNTLTKAIAMLPVIKCSSAKVFSWITDCHTQVLKRYPLRPLGRVLSSPEEESNSQHMRKLLIPHFNVGLIFLYCTSGTEEATTQLLIGKEHPNRVFELWLRKERILDILKENPQSRLVKNTSSVHTWIFLFPFTHPYFYHLSSLTNMGTVRLVLVR